jgi:hypothetical protein
MISANRLQNLVWNVAKLITFLHSQKKSDCDGDLAVFQIKYTLKNAVCLLGYDNAMCHPEDTAFFIVTAVKTPHLTKNTFIVP